MTIIYFFEILTLITVVSGFLNPTYTIRSKYYDEFYRLKSSINNIDNVEDINSFIDLHAINNEIPSNYVYKKLLKKGNNDKVYEKDTVLINWSITLISSGKCVANAEDFEFIVGANPREVIRGWDLLIKDMTVGEQCEAIINSEYAFTDKGLEELVPPNENIRCQITLKQIIPSINRSYKSVDDNNDISMKEKVARQMSNRDSELNSDIFKEDEENEEDKYIFKPTNNDFESHVIDKDINKQDKLISRNDAPTNGKSIADRGTGAGMVSGENNDYVWTETDEELEVSIPLHRNVDKVVVNIKKESISILSKNTGSIIIEGPLEQAVVPSECSWLISENDDNCTNHEDFGLKTLHLYLVKSYHSKSIWNSFLNRKYLQENQ